MEQFMRMKKNMFRIEHDGQVVALDYDDKKEFQIPQA